MKNSKLINLFMIMFLFTCSYAEVNRVAKLSDKVVKNNVVYLKGESIPFSGKLQAKGVEQEYRNGIKNGIFKGKINLEDDECLYEGNYVEGIKHGIWNLRYSTGEKRAIVKYNYDSPDGEWKIFFKNGKIKSLETYKDGLLSGPVIYYDEDGNVLKKANYINGLLEGELIFYSTKDKLDTVANFKNGKLYGNIELYSNGKIQLEGSYLNNKRASLWKLYYKTGDLKVILPYRNGMKMGKSIIYDKAGGIVQISYYRENDEVTEDGKLIKKSRKTKDEIVEKFKKFNADLLSLKINKKLSEL